MKDRARIGKVCPNCGQEVRVVSAKRLLGGKRTAKVMVECGCSTWLHHPSWHERRGLRRTETKVFS